MHHHNNNNKKKEDKEEEEEEEEEGNEDKEDKKDKEDKDKDASINQIITLAKTHRSLEVVMRKLAATERSEVHPPPLMALLGLEEFRAHARSGRY